MWHLTQMQLVHLWSELEQAYYGDNKYGGSTAEIYAYTLMEYYPTLCSGPQGERARDAYANARRVLVDVCEMFCDVRGCDIEIDGVRWDRWAPALFDHRAHVLVLHS